MGDVSFFLFFYYNITQETIKPRNTGRFCGAFPQLQFSRFQLGQHLVQAGAFHGIQAAHLIVGGEQIWHHDGDKAAGGFVTVMVPDLLPADDEMRGLYTMECTSLNEVLAKLKTGEL